jgi:hypothetical protein
MITWPYTECNDELPAYERDWWVFHPSTSRVGLVRLRQGRHYEVQFGADGPFQRIHRDHLRIATKTQVAYMEGTES